MLLRTLALVSALFIITACNTTNSAKNAGATGGSSDVIAKKYDIESGDLEAFSNLPGSKVGARAHDRVFFGFDSSVLSSDAQATLNRQVKWLKKNPDSKVTVEGHCDERGTREYNLALGDRRANAVKNYLVSSGISAGRITPISYGKERPAVVGSNHAAWAENRRGVTIVK